MHKFIICNCIELSISDEDWDYLCQNRWFTNEPEFEDIKAKLYSLSEVKAMLQDSSLLFSNSAYLLTLLLLEKLQKKSL